MIDDLGLVATLNGYARDFGKRSTIDVIVTEHGVPARPASALSHYLFRAVKELLNNAARHGHAEEIVIAVHWEPSRLRIVVDDDGSGFDSANLPHRQGPGGLGLAGISERLSTLGGGLYVESKIGQGARVILEVPIEATAV
jgi:two-component system sensor histidine kinase DegS